jgi:hypothetical protein
MDEIARAIEALIKEQEQAVQEMKDRMGGASAARASGYQAGLSRAIAILRSLQRGDT